MSEKLYMIAAFAVTPFIILGGIRIVFWSIPLILDFLDRLRDESSK